MIRAILSAMNPYTVFLLVVGLLGIVVSLFTGLNGTFLLIGVVSLVGGLVVAGARWEGVSKSDRSTKTQPSSLNSGKSDF